MADFRVDQAAGLRRLFGGGLRVIAFASGADGVGRTLMLSNLAAALARLGKNVLVLDENAGADDVASVFGLAGDSDLLDVVEGRMTMSEVLLQPCAGVNVLPAAQLLPKLASLGRRQQAAFTGAMRHLESTVDVILVDSAARHPAGFSPLVLAAHETVMVLSPNSAAITEAYTQIKKLSQANARRDFRILVGKARGDVEARGIFDNIATVAGQRGVAHLDFAGAIPFDDALLMAHRRCRPVVDLAPESASAKAVREVAGDMLYWRQSQSGECEATNFFQQLLHLSQRIVPSAIRAG